MGLFIVLFLLSLVGLFLGLIKPRVFSRFLGAGITRKKIGLLFGGTTLVLFVLIGVIAPKPVTSPQESSGAQKKEAATPTATKPREIEKKKEITYEVVERWSIPNGGEGKRILISPDYLNEADMITLGEKLKSDTQKDRNAFIWIFTDKRALEMFEKVFADEVKDKTDLDFYDKHYVGQYTKNGNTGFHEYTIYLDGFSGKNDKTIKY